MTDEMRRHVLEHPDAYSADDRAEAWAMTAQQCRENGVEWAAEIAEAEAESARQLTLVETR